MAKVSRSDFVARHIDQPLSTEGLAAARRLEGVNVRAADHNGDGRIAGEPELQDLWAGITAGRDASTGEPQRNPF